MTTTATRDRARYRDDPSVMTVLRNPRMLTREALAIHQAEVGHIPLHHQVIPWAMRANVSAVHRADNRLTAKWVRIQ